MVTAPNYGSDQPSAMLRQADRLILGLIGMGVIFASLGLGEAVYRCMFLDFDGATDRLPLELLFGTILALAATKLVRNIHRRRVAKMNLIRARSLKIRQAVEAIAPPYPSNHQAIRVIREEVDRIDGALKEIMAR